MSRGEELSGFPIAIITALFVLCAVCWSFVIPPFEAPDETGHARYVSFLMMSRRLPVAGDDAPGEAHQPPLYYALAAAAATAAGLPPIEVAPRRNPAFVWYGGTAENKYLHEESESPPLSGSSRTLHWLRLLSIAMMSATVPLVNVMARNGGVPPSEAVVSAAFVAFLPQFTFIAGTLNNDNLANPLAAAALACLAAGLRRPDVTVVWIAAGAFAGAGLLAKFTGIVMLPCGLLAVALACRGSRAAGAALAFITPAILIPAPLFIRNILVLGDPLGTAAVETTLPQLVDRKALFSPYFVTEFPAVLFRSFWGTFGWMSFRMPQAIYAACLALAVLGVLGLFLLRRDAATRKLHVLMGAAVALQTAQVVVYNLTFTQAQGRFLFPVIGPIAILSCAGLAECWRRARLPVLRRRGLLLLCSVLAILNLLILRFVVSPAYPAAALP